MENDKLNNTENESTCCGGSSPCCIENEVFSTFDNKSEEVKASETVVEKSHGGCGCGGGC